MSTLKIKYNKNIHQEKFHADTDSRILHLSAGYAAGKSFALVMKMIQLSVINKNMDGGLVAPTYGELTKDVIPILETVSAENNFEYKFNKQEKWIRFPWTAGRVWLATGERKIRGPNWAFACINEATLLDASTFKDVIGRIRLKDSKAPQLAMSGTPEGTEHWLYKELIEKQNPYANVIYGDTRNNAHNLDPFYIQTLLESYDEVMIDAYLKGLWVNMKGNRFYYSYDPDKNHAPNTFNPDHEILIAMDFNVNPMTCTLWHKHEGVIYGFDEITLQGADTKKLCDAIKARGYDPAKCIVYPDPSGNSRKTSGRSDVQILKENGFLDVRFKPVAPRMRQRQLNVNNLLSKQQIIFNPITMPKLKQDLAAVSQDMISLGKDKKNPELTHWSDGLDYLCDIEFPFSGKKPTIKTFVHTI